MPVCGLGINLILRFSQGSLRGLLFLYKEFFGLGGCTPWTVSDGGEVYSPNVGGKRFLKKSSLALAGARRGGHRRWRSVLAERRRKAFLKKFFSLGRRTPWRPPTVEKCTFLLCGRKVPKRTHPRGANLRIRPPWGSPHSRGDASWGRAHPCRSLHPAERRLSGSSLRPRSYSPVCALELFSGQANHWTPRPGGLMCVPVGASAVQMAVGMKFLGGASPLG